MNALKQQLARLTTGDEDANAYRICVLEILRFLFDPDLTDGRIEAGNIIFANASEKSFWAFLRWEHSASSLMFASINVAALTDDHLDQTAAHLGQGGVSLAFIVTRSAPAFEHLSKTYAMFKDFTPRKVILILSETDLKAMLDLKTSGRDPVSYIQTLYRGFRDSVR